MSFRPRSVGTPANHPVTKFRVYHRGALGGFLSAPFLFLGCGFSPAPWVRPSGPGALAQVFPRVFRSALASLVTSRAGSERVCAVGHLPGELAPRLISGWWPMPERGSGQMRSPGASCRARPAGHAGFHTGLRCSFSGCAAGPAPSTGMLVGPAAGMRTVSAENSSLKSSSSSLIIQRCPAPEKPQKLSDYSA